MYYMRKHQSEYRKILLILPKERKLKKYKAYFKIFKKKFFAAYKTYIGDKFKSVKTIFGFVI